MVTTQIPEKHKGEDTASESPSRTVLDEVIDLWWSQTQKESHLHELQDEYPSST